MTLGMVLEKTGHEHFAEFDNSQLCYYDISGLEQSRRDEWIRGLLKNHHHVIYASEPEKAVAFETDLLEEEWAEAACRYHRWQKAPFQALQDPPRRRASMATPP